MAKATKKVTTKKPNKKNQAQESESPERGPEAWGPKFLAALADSPNIAGAAKAVGITRQRAYFYAKSHPIFAEAWKDALAQGIDKAEGEMYRRAVEGWEDPVYQNGLEVGRIRKYSDTLLIFLLKGHRPERYREAARVTNYDVDLTQLSTEQLQRIADGEDPARVLADTRPS